MTRASPTPRGLGPPRGNLWTTLGWACYLGSSWTWVIGMFLPVLLVRDYGVAGWWAFAIPNVIGAAAVGFIWKSATASRRAVRDHRVAMVMFSLVTLALHGFVIAAWLPVIFGPQWAIAALGGAIVVALCAERGPHAVVLAVVATAVSAFAIAWWNHDLSIWHVEFPYDPPLENRLTNFDLLLAGPGLAIGFLLCPHLDLTLHRARQALRPGAGRWAFLVGFFLVFAAMISFALLYAPFLRGAFSTRISLVLSSGLATMLALHITTQAAFTTGVHVKALSREWGRCASSAGLLLLLAGVSLGAWLQLEDVRGDFSLALDASEIGYRSILVCYALPFPAVVLYFMTPLRRRAPRQHRLLVTLVVTIAGTPFALLGFIFCSSLWLLGVFGAVLLGAMGLWLVPSHKSDRPQPATLSIDGAKHGV